MKSRWFGVFTLFTILLILAFSSCKKESNKNPVSNHNNTDTTTTYPDTTIPAPPTSFQAEIISSHRVLLVWQDNSQREAGFRIDRKVLSDTGYSVLGVVDSNVVRFTDSTVNLTTLTYYRVYAFNSYGNSPYTNTDSVVIHTFTQGDQTAIAPPILDRIYEITLLVDQFQHGYGALHSYPDTTEFLRQTNGNYKKTTADTLAESVRFNPDIWRYPTRTQDSSWYRWDLYGGDTVHHGKYSYEVNSKRLTTDSIAKLSGTARFDLTYFGRGWGGALNDYSYWLTGTFIQPVALDSAYYRWTGSGISTALDLTPIRWAITGSSLRNSSGSWYTEFSYADSIFMKAEVDSAGVGYYQLKWDNFSTTYSYQHQ